MKRSKRKLIKNTRKVSNSDYIFDTNIILVADRLQEDENISEDCIQSCLQWIRKLLNKEIKLVIDGDGSNSNGFIFAEYKKYYNKNDMQCIRSQFLKWIINNGASDEYVKKIPITPIKESDTEFKEFPNDANLKTFEGADRKFVATAISYFKQNKKHSPILEACDTDYIFHEEALMKYVEVKLICEKDIRELHRRKTNK